jgi:hypothetical protein
VGIIGLHRKGRNTFSDELSDLIFFVHSEAYITRILPLD